MIGPDQERSWVDQPRFLRPRGLVAGSGIKHRAVRNGLRLLDRWPARSPLIIGRERSGAAGEPDALISRDQPPGGDWVWAGHRLLESPVPFWIKWSIWLIKYYHRNDRYFWTDNRRVGRFFRRA